MNRLRDYYRVCMAKIRNYIYRKLFKNEDDIFKY